MKTTLNPFENAKRTANGTGGGVSPAVIEEIQAEISVLGSQNETQAQDITDIKAQLEELAGEYSTTEHKTGRKWIDGTDIYERVVDVNVELEQVTTIIADASYIDDIISCVAIAVTTHAYTPILCYIDDGALKGKAMTGFTASQIIIQYTKQTA